MSTLEQRYLQREQHLHFLEPHMRVEDDRRAVYEEGQVYVGWPEGADYVFDRFVRPNTRAVIGIQFGDEGKGRLVDNKLQELIKIPGVKQVYVVRYQGGANAGHTLYTDEGTKIPVNQVPSSILHPEAIGVMDSGMVIHMEDLRTEITTAEDKVGEDLSQRLVLSEDAILLTDLERAEEVLNRYLSDGNSDGGTGRGIGPAYSHYYDKTGLFVRQLMDEDWRETLGNRYDNYEKEFRAHGFELAKMDVPDKIESARQGKSVPRALGTKEEFLAKLEDVREWYKQRDMIQNTFIIHEKAYRDLSNGFMFEGAQAMGLHAWLGRLPDVTASDMSLNGITAGTKFWKGDEVEHAFGVFKFSYMSSVGATEWKTQYDIPRTKVSDEQAAQMNDEQQYALWIREEAKETGTTTGRYRDICKIDLAMMRYNCHLGGIGMLAGTHLDIARDLKDSIQVCTHYEDLAGNYVPYEPGIHHRKDVVPHYEKFDGWDGKKVQDATSFEELPDNAKKYLAFVQRQMGIPIVFATTGYQRHNILEIPKVKIPKEVMRKQRNRGNIFHYGNGEVQKPKTA